MLHADVVLHQRADAVARPALPEHVRVCIAGDTADVPARLAAVGAAAVILPLDPRATDWLDVIVGELGQRAPALLVVATASGGREDARAAVTERWPHVEIIDQTDRELRTRFRRLIAASTVEARLSAAGTAMATGVPPEVAALVRCAVQRAHARDVVARWSAGTGLSRRTVERRIDRHLGVTTERLLMWGRLVAAAVLLESTLLRVSDIAQIVGYEEATGLTKLSTALISVPPTRVVAAGGVRAVLERWHGVLQQQESRRGA